MSHSRLKYTRKLVFEMLRSSGILFILSVLGALLTYALGVGSWPLIAAFTLALGGMVPVLGGVYAVFFLASGTQFRV